MLLHSKVGRRFELLKASEQLAESPGIFPSRSAIGLPNQFSATVRRDLLCIHTAIHRTRQHHPQPLDLSNGGLCGRRTRHALRPNHWLDGGFRGDHSSRRFCPITTRCSFSRSFGRGGLILSAGLAGTKWRAALRIAVPMRAKVAAPAGDQPSTQVTPDLPSHRAKLEFSGPGLDALRVDSASRRFGGVVA